MTDVPDGEGVYVELDTRRRVSLARLVKNPSRFYLAHDEPDGTIVLVPAVVMTKRYADKLLKRSYKSDQEG